MATATGTGTGILLIEAIKKAHRDTLQDVLISMCSTSSVCALEASQRLLITKDELIADITSKGETDRADSAESEDEHEEKDSEDSDIEVVRVTKRPRVDTEGSNLLVRYETCRKCKQQFDITTNGPTACNIHTGGISMYDEEDYWADDDFPPDDVDDPNDPMVRDYPEGFRWSCCEGDGAAPPCVAGRHEV